MKLIIILLLILPFLISNNWNENRTRKTIPESSDTTAAWTAPKSADRVKNPIAGISDAMQKGENLFIQNCTTCHGMTGQGDGPTADMLDTKPANLMSPNVQNETDGALFWKISNGKGAMAAYKQAFSEEQIWQLVNYIRQLGNQKPNQKK